MTELRDCALGWKQSVRVIPSNPTLTTSLSCLPTTQASVYCVAAVLWTAAKFSVPRDHKLALPRRLKTLLLDMARRHASERPSAAEAIKVTARWSGLLTFSGVRVEDSRALDAEASVNHSCLQNSSTWVGSMLRIATSCTWFRSKPAVTL